MKKLFAAFLIIVGIYLLVDHWVKVSDQRKASLYGNPFAGERDLFNRGLKVDGWVAELGSDNDVKTLWIRYLWATEQKPANDEKSIDALLEKTDYLTQELQKTYKVTVEVKDGNELLNVGSGKSLRKVKLN